MEKPKDKKPSPVVNIAADGDVILVVGPEQVKLRAHSLFLKATSKPFSAMLGPNWKEGNDLLNRDGPLELLLPEDNASALELICSIIHHQNNKVPESLAASDVLGVAVTADKYDCVNALKFAIENWLRPGKSEAGDLMLLTAAAYLFQNAQAFKEITRELIFNYAGPYLALSSEEVESAMTWRVFCRLEEQRSGVRLKLAQTLIRGINDGTGMCVHRCEGTGKCADAYLKMLETNGLSPARLVYISISKAIELVEKMTDTIPEKSSIEYMYEYRYTAPKYRGDYRWDWNTSNHTIGLCLHAFDRVVSIPIVLTAAIGHRINYPLQILFHL